MPFKIFERDESAWAQKPGSYVPKDTGTRYDTDHAGVQPATVNPDPNEPWVSDEAAHGGK
jgi:hypothetical protein